jgi:hypothetical protein
VANRPGFHWAHGCVCTYYATGVVFHIEEPAFKLLLIFIFLFTSFR